MRLINTLGAALNSPFSKLAVYRAKRRETKEEQHTQSERAAAVRNGLPFKFTIDEKRIKSEAGPPDVQGAQDGARGLPSAASILPTDYEQRVFELVEQEGQLLREKLGQAVRVYEADFREADTHIDVDPATLVAIRRGIHEVQRPRILSEEVRLLQPLKEQENQTQAALALFKTENNLWTRPEERMNVWLGSALLVILVVIESSINGFVMKDVQAGGILGAILVSIAFSVFNIALAFLCGMVLGKNTLHVSGYRRAMAWLGLLLMLPVMLAVNGWFAGVRAVAEQQQDLNSGINAASERFVHAPWELIQDPAHLWMLCVGMAFSLMAFWKGMHWSDCYPGYTKMTQRAERAEHRFQRAVDKARLRIDASYQAGMNTMRAVAAGNAPVLAKFHGDMREYLNLAETYNYALARLNQLLQTLTFIYRSENVRHRGEAPPPRYFSSPVQISLSAASFDTHQLTALYVDMAARCEHFEKKILMDQLRYLEELRLLALAQLDADVSKILGVPQDELPTFPPLRKENVSSLSIQKHHTHRKNTPDHDKPDDSATA
jgi:hypothetical protein